MASPYVTKMSHMGKHNQTALAKEDVLFSEGIFSNTSHFPDGTGSQSGLQIWRETVQKRRMISFKI